MEKWNYNPSEDEPVAFINAGEREFEINRGNTRLYTFMANLALYDHVHYSDNETAFYVFNFEMAMMSWLSLLLLMALQCTLISKKYRVEMNKHTIALLKRVCKALTQYPRSG